MSGGVLPPEASRSFTAGRARGRKDGADWARDRAAVADLRRLGEGAGLEPQLDGLLERYGLDPRGLARAGGHGAEEFCSGYLAGFQAAARSVWQGLCQVACDLQSLAPVSVVHAIIRSMAGGGST